LADDEDDDTENGPTLLKDDDDEKVLPGELKAQFVEQTTALTTTYSGSKSWNRTLVFRLRQDSRSSMVCRENLQPALFEARHETLEREQPAWSERLFCVLASPIFWNEALTSSTEAPGPPVRNRTCACPPPQRHFHSIAQAAPQGTMGSGDMLPMHE
jgi:hypothetical protein